MEKFDTAQICINGHLISSAIETKPQSKRDFCDDCGAETICNCPNCKKPIKGDYMSSESNGKHKETDIQSLLDSLGSDIPLFCDSCGEAFPWLQKRFDLIIEFTEQLNTLTFEQKNDFKSSIIELIKRTPKTPIVKIKLKKILSTLDKDTSDYILDFMKEILPRHAFNEINRVSMENTANSIWKILRMGKNVQYMNFSIKYKNDEVLIMKQNSFNQFLNNM